ncbi:DUF6223 family protein [Flavitalea sp. BT771]|uniref:DUF6223 family protein n=1 Tax=Flavitalea sp. BT771 TaxID=3063329 RepID=UPI0026E1F9A1|nr:DUF6223 family protein [Flavitalea sp. BT771]MDO6433644.1 DUF6223 family protein [Flavitalea sp. BT771]MDV6222451.1 DUF6223 family protein [Flavitalea sp. BT771]
MKKHFAYLLLIGLIVAFIFLLPGEVFSQADSTYVKGITTGRARALIGVAVGLVSFGIGWRAKGRQNKGTGDVRTGAILALVLGLIGIVLSAIHLSVTAGAVFGSGSGKAGAIFAFVPNLIGIALGASVLRKINEKKPG